MPKTMNEISYELSDLTGVHPENIDVQSDGAGICVFIEVVKGTDSKPILDAAFDYLRELEFSNRMVEVRTA